MIMLASFLGIQLNILSVRKYKLILTCAPTQSKRLAPSIICTRKIIFLRFAAPAFLKGNSAWYAIIII